MKKIFLHTCLSLLLILVMAGCSMNKNTWTTRTYKAINTKYNVKFNGQTSFDEGIKSIQKANVEDFSEVLPMYPISKPANAKVATSNMDRAIEKSRKAIKLHSIKKKPIRNSRRTNDPEYKLFYNQEEFNPALKDVWMLLAMSEFHKGDFMGSVGTFSYIARHYATDKEMVMKSQLWIARAYSEMGWIYEAEQLLSKLNQNDITYKITPLYTAVNADLMIKKHQYKEAIPFLEITLSREKNKYQKQRFTYILAQLYELTGDKIKALETYRKVLKLTPSYEMDFNARVSSIELNPNVNEVRKEIRKLIKNPNNKDYLDQLYYANGKTYLQKGDTAKALENFALSVEKSTRNGIEKAITLINMGDLYYNMQNYVKAQPCYDDASKIITTDHPDYKRISSRALALGELVVEYQTVVLQDSLQKLATLSEEKRLEIVKKIIEKLIADEKAEAEKAQTEEQNNQNSGGFEPDFMPQPVTNRAGGGGEWYFYNPTLMKSGQQDFQKKWGKRKLEDNWRRMNKSAAIFAENIENKSDLTENINADSIQSLPGNESNTEVVSDNKDPKFYLQQIPVTDAQIQKSNEMIADALFKMGYIYKDKVEDFGVALNTFSDFTSRFSADERVPEALFQMYLLNTMLGKTDVAQTVRAKLRTDYPLTRFAILLETPDFLALQEEMLQVQDSVYNVTYEAFNKSDFAGVKQNTSTFVKKYPQSKLVPKFLFLNALSIGKTEKPEKFETALDELVTNYPESDVSSMSKDILALMKQGKESKTGTSQGTLLARRTEVLQTGDSANVTQNFSASKDTRHRLLLVIPADESLTIKLLYNIAAFNFSRFMVKDFDLVIAKIDSLQNSLSVTGFETYDETSWYLSSLLSDVELKNLIEKQDIQQIIISENNYGLLRTVFTLQDYLAYHAEKIVTAKPEIKTLASTTPKSQNTAVAQNKQSPKTQTPKTPETNTVAAVTPAVNQENKLDREYLERATSIPEKSVVPDKGTSNNMQTTTSQPSIEKAEPEAPLYKNLFAYKPNQPHFIALAIVSGSIDFEQTKDVFDKYNAINYGIMNLKVSLETIGRMKFVIIGQFADANVAKSYLLRMVREKPLFQNMGDASYRNLVGTQENLNVMVQENALRTYLEFMQEYYLK